MSKTFKRRSKGMTSTKNIAFLHFLRYSNKSFKGKKKGKCGRIITENFPELRKERISEQSIFCIFSRINIDKSTPRNMIMKLKNNKEKKNNLGISYGFASSTFSLGYFFSAKINHNCLTCILAGICRW